MVGGTKVQTAIFIPGKVDDLSWVLWKQNLTQFSCSRDLLRECFQEKETEGSGLGQGRKTELECGLRSAPRRKLWAQGVSQGCSHVREREWVFVPKCQSVIGCEQVRWRREWCHLSGEGVLVWSRAILSRRGQENFVSNTHLYWVGKGAQTGSTMAALEIINRNCIFRSMKDGKWCIGS